MSRTLFISDLHLDPERPAATGLFLDLLQQQAGAADALYILGDLFEAWIGDDDDSEPGFSVRNTLKSCADAGTRVFLMHGNRDFLLGDRFAAQSGCTLLDDPAVIDLYGVPTLLMHGDTLCTDDTAYQQFRAQVRDPAWQAELLGRSLEQRRAMARELRAASRAHTGGKLESIMDVNHAAVIDIMTRYGTKRLIHGHTHRPGTHDFQVNHEAMQRIVLGDWYEQGSMLTCNTEGCTLQSMALPAG